VTDPVAGIRPSDAPPFIIAQLLGAAAATALFQWLAPTLAEVAPAARPSLTFRFHSFILFKL
jgi:glycerol uptake facilitator-like aquaporin